MCAQPLYAHECTENSGSNKHH